MISRRNDRAIAFKREYVYLTGSINAALMLSQATYWSNRAGNAEGWFYKTAKEWESETGLTLYEQQGARKRLKETSFWYETLAGVPSQLYFRVDFAALNAELDRLDEEDANAGLGNIEADTVGKNRNLGFDKTGPAAVGKNQNLGSEEQKPTVGKNQSVGSEISKPGLGKNPNLYTESTPEITTETTPLIDHGARTGQSGLGKTKAPERTAAVQAGQTLNVQPSVASPSLSAEVAALAQLLADVGIGVNAFTFEQYKDLADEYGMPAVIAGVHAAANQGKQQSFKYVSACIVNAAKGAGNDNRTAHRTSAQTHSAQSPLPGAGREFERTPARKPYDPRLEAVFNS